MSSLGKRQWIFKPIIEWLISNLTVSFDTKGFKNPAKNVTSSRGLTHNHWFYSQLVGLILFVIHFYTVRIKSETCRQ